MGRKILYGIVGGFSIPILLGLVWGFILIFFPNSAPFPAPYGLILIIIVVLGSILLGVWFGGILDKRLKRKPLTPEQDRFFSYIFVVILIVISFFVDIIMKK